MKKNIAKSTTIFLVFLLTYQYTAFAYRPFVSTDASVAEKGKADIELGMFDISSQDDNKEIKVPSLRLNYGFIKNWEFVYESDLQIYASQEARNVELIEPAAFFQGIIREGILQKAAGPSFSIEFGTLLPSTVKNERSAGLEGIAIVSLEFWKFLFHVNLGMEFDRKDFDPGIIWGTIMEYPFEGKFRLVAEINGSGVENQKSENSGLIGFIWNLGAYDLDFGARKGFSRAADDWELTTGITFSI
ncbi:MAG: hypothetical protein HZB37_09590 [Planctomycetes bacterium]|nr:hypothetical protein [Candidatus Omnitrophota bacterium]MBI5308561.1 hypothetical protein [Planctomycetota bacterium]